MEEQEKNKIQKLLEENILIRENCNLCQESPLEVGKTTSYGAKIIYRIGNSFENSWFATLSPKTGSDPKKDFTIQLMPSAHLTHFSQLNHYPELAKNYGLIFSNICQAMTQIIGEETNTSTQAEIKNDGIAIATYGKCTTWKEKKEHLHIKIFPFRGNIGQSYTVDSSYGRKEIHKDPKTNQDFIKMDPVKKIKINQKRFNELSEKLISILKCNK